MVFDHVYCIHFFSASNVVEFIRGVTGCEFATIVKIFKFYWLMDSLIFFLLKSNIIGLMNLQNSWLLKRSCKLIEFDFRSFNLKRTIHNTNSNFNPLYDIMEPIFL